MSVLTVADPITYECNGLNDEFVIPFVYLEESYVWVRRKNNITLEVTTLVLTDDYTIASDTVTTNTVYPSGDTISLSLLVPMTQLVDLETNGRLDSDLLDAVHDKLTLMAQGMSIERDSIIGLEIPENPAPTLSLPDVSLRASRYLAFDSLGNLMVASLVDTTTITISPYGETLVEAADAAAARAILDTYSEAEVDSEIDADVATLEADLGGTGRTTETIKDNADDIIAAIRGYNAISLTNWDSTSTAPQVASGSAIEANGVMYSVSTNTTISTTDASSGVNYLVFDDDTETFGWNDTAPTWSASLNGWYVSGDRFTGHVCTWDGSTSYTDKKKYRDNSQDADDSLSLVWLHHYVAVTYVTKAVLYAAVSSWVPTIDSVITVVGTLVGDTFGDTASGQAQYLQRTSATTIDLIYTDIAGAKVTTECGPTYTGSPRKKYQLYTNDIERA